MGEVIVNNGELNALGVDIKISDIIGKKLVNQWIAQLSEEQTNAIFKAINDEVFENIEYTEPKKIQLKKRQKNTSGWSCEKEDTRLWKIIQNTLAEKLGEEIKKKAEEIINSEAYQKKADEIANELVEYATDGYKNDMKFRLKERLVGNVISSIPSCDSIDLISLIRQEINNTINTGRY